jgi:hypothetical protein
VETRVRLPLGSPIFSFYRRNSELPRIPGPRLLAGAELVADFVDPVAVEGSLVGLGVALGSYGDTEEVLDVYWGSTPSIQRMRLGGETSFAFPLCKPFSRQLLRFGYLGGGHKLGEGEP